MSFQEKIKKIQEKNHSSLVVGLDIDPSKIPEYLQKNNINPFLFFLQEIVNATKKHVCAYKPNIAFYESLGVPGIQLLKDIINFIPSDIPIILDIKRGDIGNTAAKYAYSAFEDLKVDAVTLSPYMGSDSIYPFLEYKDKYAFILVLTSNQSSQELQLMKSEKGNYIFQEIALLVNKWNLIFHNCGAVMGATNSSFFDLVENELLDSYILVPGVGTQGGTISDILTKDRNNKKKYLFNVSRDILYSSNEKDFAKKASEKAKYYQEEINKFL
jgi:orotidine-5'-phosphate decarboxylase